MACEAGLTREKGTEPGLAASSSSSDTVVRALAASARPGNVPGSGPSRVYPWHEGLLVHRYWDAEGVDAATLQTWRLSVLCFDAFFLQIVWTPDVDKCRETLGEATPKTLCRSADVIVAPSTRRRWRELLW